MEGHHAHSSAVLGCHVGDLAHDLKKTAGRKQNFFLSRILRKFTEYSAAADGVDGNPEDSGHFLLCVFSVLQGNLKFPCS